MWALQTPSRLWYNAVLFSERQTAHLLKLLASSSLSSGELSSTQAPATPHVRKGRHCPPPQITSPHRAPSEGHALLYFQCRDHCWGIFPHIYMYVYAA